MKRAIVLVDHGSRRPEADAVLEQVAELVRRRVPDRIVRTAHLVLSPPTVLEAIEACVAEGARDIVVHPYFLAPGNHAAQDIPALARLAAERHPGVVVRVSAPLGVHQALVEAILERVGEA